MINATANDNSVIVKNITDFNPEHSFMCGQCFRWDKEEDGSFTGIAFSKPVNISCRDNTLVIKNITYDEYESYWKHYLDLDTDYNFIKKSVSVDDNIIKALNFGWGIKILNQEFFECLISFIISTQNAIPRIKKIVSKISEMYGKSVVYNGKTFYAFPTPEELRGVTVQDLEPLKAGYRAAYIVDAVEKVLSGEISADKISALSYGDAKKELMKIKGVGPKVADCVLLFSCSRKEAFPIDVWVQRTVRTLYLGDGATQKQIEKFAAEYFGDYAGVAQQYLFYHSRETGLKG